MAGFCEYWPCSLWISERLCAAVCWSTWKYCNHLWWDKSSGVFRRMGYFFKEASSHALAWGPWWCWVSWKLKRVLIPRSLFCWLYCPWPWPLQNLFSWSGTHTESQLSQEAFKWTILWSREDMGRACFLRIWGQVRGEDNGNHGEGTLCESYPNGEYLFNFIQG